MRRASDLRAIALAPCCGFSRLKGFDPRFRDDQSLLELAAPVDVDNAMVARIAVSIGQHFYSTITR